MCAVSMIGDDWARKWSPNIIPSTGAPSPTGPYPNAYTLGVSKEEFDKLKKEVESLKKLLIAAKIYDEETGQKNCEMDEKVELIKKIAELVGVDVSEVFE